MEFDDLVDFAFDHVDKTVAELIGSRNYKQALKNLDKKRKKGTPASVQQQAIKAALLCALGDHGASHTVVIEILAAHVPPYEAEVCGILYTLLCDLKNTGFDVNEKTLETVWSKTIAAETRHDEKVHLVKEWMFMAIRRGHWNLVVKVTFVFIVRTDLLSEKVDIIRGLPARALTRPKNRLHTVITAAGFVVAAGDNTEVLKQWTWQLCARYLYHLEKLHTLSNGSELDRRLALQILQKAAKDAPGPPESIHDAGKWITTDKHLKLLAEVYQREAQQAQLLTLLEEPKFAQLVDGNNEFICMKASLWHKCPPESCRRALDWVTTVMIAAPGKGGQWLRDDCRLWRILAHACPTAKQRPSSDTTSTHSTHEAELRKLVWTHSPSAPMNRAPALALLDFILSENPSEEVHTSEEPMSHRIDACVEFFQTHVDRDFAALDIQPRLRSMSLLEHKKVSQEVHRITEKLEETAMTQKSNTSLTAWIRAATSALSIDRIIYDATTARGSRPSDSEHQTLVHYIGLCLNLYKQTFRLDAKQKIALSNTAKTNLENVAWSLSLLSQSEDNPSLIHLRSLINLSQQDIGQTDDWRVQVISDLQRVGATYQAWIHYTKLEVKHMLIETAAPMLFCQMSTTLPYGAKGLDSHLEIKRHLKFYKEMLTMVPQHQELALDHQNYDQCIRMHDFLQEVRASPVRWMLGLERRRTSRLRGLSYDGDDILHNPVQMPVLSKTTRDLWVHAPTMTHNYIHLLAYIDDLDECIRRPAEDEAIYLDRVRTRRPKIRTSSHTLRHFDLLFMLAEGLTSRDVDLVSGGLEVLKQSISTLVEGVPPSSITSQPDSDPIPAFDPSRNFDLAFLQSCTKLCKKVPSRIADRKVKTEATSVASEAKEAAEAIYRSTKQRLDSLKALKKDNTMVEKLLHLKQRTSFETSVMEVVGEVRAKEYFAGLIDSRIDTENSLLNILVD